MRLLICGSRTWTDRAPVDAAVANLSPKDDLVICGYDPASKYPPGADRFAYEACYEHGIQVICVPAMWDAFPRSAGFKRNGVMATLRPDKVLAFRTPGKSNGTDDMLLKGHDVGAFIEKIEYQQEVTF